jgi:glycerol kinase
MSEDGTSLRELRVDGGAARNDWLMQFQADILGLPVVRQELTESTALGVALLARIGVGLWTDPPALAATETSRFVPRKDPRIKAWREGWREAVKRVL